MAKNIQVSVAVLHYQNQYLLGYRQSHQHQGNRYEFIGGKIESDETAICALKREVLEEIGLDIENNACVKLGRLCHDYGDKQVCLHIYNVPLNDQQYQQFQSCQIGLEGQSLHWVVKDDLIAGKYPLPNANKTILTWLALPPIINITQPISFFDNMSDGININRMSNPNPNNINAWLNFHCQKLPQKTCVYLRPKLEVNDNTQTSIDVQQTTLELYQKLSQQRPDLTLILPIQLYQTLKNQSLKNHTLIPSNILACHITHQQLLQLDFDKLLQINLDKPIIASCHDKNSLSKANQLAQFCLQHQLAPVLAVFLSPVFATQTHPNVTTLGWKNFAQLANIADMPVIALGGLTPKDKKQAYVEGGAMSIAGIRHFFV